MGNTSRDMTLYKDDDGSGYLISEDVCIDFSHDDGDCSLRVDQFTTLAANGSSYLQTDR